MLCCVQCGSGWTDQFCAVCSAAAAGRISVVVFAGGASDERLRTRRRRRRSGGPGSRDTSSLDTVSALVTVDICRAAHAMRRWAGGLAG